MNNKIVFLGDCIPKGTTSFYDIINGELRGVTGRIVEERQSLIEKLKKEGCVIKNMCQGHSAMSFVGCSKPSHADSIDVKISVVYKLLNNNLSSFDTIIINCPINDYRKTNKEKLGDFKTKDENTVYGSYAIIFDELKRKYSNKNIIFILPSYGKKIKNQISFLEFYNNIKKEITKQEYNYVSFFDYFHNFVSYDDMSYFFPDGAHPSIDCKIMYIKYCADNIINMLCVKNNEYNDLKKYKHGE